jgi:hypothetical protein
MNEDEATTPTADAVPEPPEVAAPVLAPEPPTPAPASGPAEGEDFRIDDWRGYEHFTCLRCRWDGLGRANFEQHWQEMHVGLPVHVPLDQIAADDAAFSAFLASKTWETAEGAQ